MSLPTKAQKCDESSQGESATRHERIFVSGTAHGFRIGSRTIYHVGFAATTRILKKPGRRASLIDHVFQLPNGRVGQETPRHKVVQFAQIGDVVVDLQLKEFSQTSA
jgi:hypothetical protein